ncbi:MAG: threonine synthase [Anaerolineae bacterium]
MRLQCLACQREWPLDPKRWRCECGGLLDVVGAPCFDPARVDARTYSLWRYREALPLSGGAQPVTLGEGWTPLVDLDWDGRSVRFKMESLNPTGSFKDRGAALLVTALKAAGVREVVEDSSGNAGAALSAYAARGGLDATIYVPAHASPVKRSQIAVYGAQIAVVPGSRSDTAAAVLKALDQGAVYATHAYNPFYTQGMKTVAYELWEQCGGCAPDSILVPVGHGGLLLGLHRGFGELLSAGLIRRWPRLVGVQAEACAPLARAWERGEDAVEPVVEGDTIAGGVRIAAPPWGRHVLAAVRQTGGAIIALSDEMALAAQAKLARRGLYVEPTSALAVAALDHLGQGLGETPVVVLTGSGFKSPPKMGGIPSWTGSGK